jgi:hypothetical protein
VLVDDWLDPDGHRTLLWWRGEWYQHVGSHWAARPKDTDGKDAVTKHLMLRLESAWYLDESLKEPRVKKWSPDKTRVAKVAHAMATVLLRLPDDVEPRTWLDPDGQPPVPPDEIVACTNAALLQPERAPG